jgi:hypothetical protein
MRRNSLTVLLLIVLASLAMPTLATAKPSKRAKAAKPEITRVTPMRLGIGQQLVIRGRNFKPRAKRNTVIFRAGDGRTAFAKPRRATRRKLVLTVPAAAARLLKVRDGAQQPTRLKLRVLAGKFSRFTPRRLSPVVTGIRLGSDGKPVAVCKSSSDHDGDLLPNALELTLKTDPCLRDTDNDGVEDGYEVQAAIDLNHYPANTPLPYPDKRPYPNALDPNDQEVDYDGDGLTLREEYLLWLRYSSDGSRRSQRPATPLPLTAGERLVYSDGLQHSLNPAPAVPGDLLLAWVLDQDANGVLSDGERDADADGLGNWDEVRGRLTEDWWVQQYDGDNGPKESQYPEINFLDNADLPDRDAHADPDVDGDELLDGADDYDHDGLSNQYELRRPDDWLTDAGIFPPADPAPNPWAYVQPFNPCKPFSSDRCHDHPPFGYYNDDDDPPVGPVPPAGYPAGAPTTPDGP